jgi:hypothetical protein
MRCAILRTGADLIRSASASLLQLLHLVGELGDPRCQARQCLDHLIEARIRASRGSGFEYPVQLQLFDSYVP